MTRPRTTTDSDWGGNAAFALTVVGAYAALLLSSRQRIATPEFAALIALGIVYTLVGLSSIWYVEQGSLLRRLLFFVIEVAIGSEIIYLSGGFGFMGFMLLPLASHAVFLLPRRWMLIVCAAIVLIAAAVYGAIGGWDPFIQSAIGYTVAAVFVVVFTQVAVNEHNARAEIERLAAELAEANCKLREYAAQVEELATTRERNRLAREIHDSLGHSLTTINIQLEAALAIAETDRPKAIDALRKAQALTKEGLAEIRRSVATLRDSPLQNRSLVDAIGSLVEECRAAGILAEYRVLGAARPLKPQAELTLYRVAQEGLTNIRKHSHASRAEVSIDFGSPDAVCLVLSDNGVGADAASGGFGLIGIRERVQLLNGTIKMSTEPGKGFRLETMLPG